MKLDTIKTNAYVKPIVLITIKAKVVNLNTSLFSVKILLFLALTKNNTIIVKSTLIQKHKMRDPIMILRKLSDV